MGLFTMRFLVGLIGHGGYTTVTALCHGLQSLLGASR